MATDKEDPKVEQLDDVSSAVALSFEMFVTLVYRERCTGLR
jgi:hypothetical protein